MSVESKTTELPGLELPPVVTEPTPGHWRELGQSKRLMLFAGRSHPELAERIAEKLGLELGEITLKTFADGETYCRYEESVRGADLFIVQTGCDPVDRHLMELLIMIQAAQLASAKRVTAVVPWFPYSRQDKKSAPREPVTGKLVADFLQTAGVDRVLPSAIFVTVNNFLQAAEAQQFRPTYFCSDMWGMCLDVFTRNFPRNQWADTRGFTFSHSGEDKAGAPFSPAVQRCSDILEEQGVRGPLGMRITPDFDHLRQPIIEKQTPGVEFEILPRDYRLSSVADAYVNLAR